MNRKLHKLILTLLSIFFLFTEQNHVFAIDHYDETDSVVFENNRAYFKFNDSDITNYIVNNWWTKNIVFTEAEKKIMHDYTYNQATPINTAIETVKGDIEQLSLEIKQQVVLLDQATHKLAIPWDIIVYRYVYETFLLDLGLTQSDLNQYYKDKRFDPEILSKIKSGTQYKKYSFMSTTALKYGALTHRPIELRLRVKQGSYAAFVAPYSYFPSELEFLFPRGGQLEVIGAYLSEDNKRLNIEVHFKGSL